MKYAKRMLWLLGVIAVVSALGCGSPYREIRERETTSFSVRADSSRANTALDLRGERASLDEAARAYGEINRSATQREQVEIEKLRIASEERKFKEWIELLKKNPELAQSYGIMFVPGTTGATPGFSTPLTTSTAILKPQRGMVHNESSYTLRAEIYKGGRKILNLPFMEARIGKVWDIFLYEGRDYSIRFYHPDGRLFRVADFDIDGEEGNGEEGADWSVWVR